MPKFRPNPFTEPKNKIEEKEVPNTWYNDSSQSQVDESTKPGYRANKSHSGR